MRLFQKRRDAKRLAQIGSCVDTCYLLKVNNEPEMTFAERADLLKYLENFRHENQIFKLEIYRMEMYSL